MSIAGTVFCSTVCKTIVIPSDQEEMQERGKKARHQLSKIVQKWNLKHHFGLHFGSHFEFKIDVWEVLEPLGTTLDTTWDPQGHPGPKKNEKVILRRSPWDQVGTLNHYCRSHLNLQVHFATVFWGPFSKRVLGSIFEGPKPKKWWPLQHFQLFFQRPRPIQMKPKWTTKWAQIQPSGSFWGTPQATQAKPNKGP